MLITCAKLPGKEWRVRGEWKEHLQKYLKSTEDLHYWMRKIGVDWFTAKPLQEPHTEEHKTAISEGMRRGRVWNRGLKLGPRKDFKPPNVKEWMIITSSGMHTVKNLKGWLRRNNLPYDVIKMRIRKQGPWPYQTPTINILKIQKWS